MTAATALYLSRARLRRDVPAAALHRLLVDENESTRVAATHRLVWMLFGDTPDRARDFLWREAEPGLFYLLSQRPPDDVHHFFHVEPPKPFAPALSAGDRLAFALRVNPTVARQAVGRARAKDGRVRGGRCDVVMDALHGIPSGARAEPRRDALDDVVHAWLARQGERSGFSLDPLAPAGPPTPIGNEEIDDGEDDGYRASFRATGYRVLRLGRGKGTARMQVGVVDAEGVLTVRHPGTFVAALGRGFGRAKAFGCGLMLIRRA